VLPSFRLDGKVAVITGGGRGIGQAIALAFAESGASLALLSRTPGELEDTVAQVQARGGRALSLVADVRDRQALAQAFAHANDVLGRLDILVNNAGTTVRKPAMDYTDDEYEHVMSTNVKGVLLTTQAAVPYLAQSDDGRIINISSVAAFLALKTRVVYGSSKAAVSHLTKGLAAELAEQGIRVNAVAPGMVRTAMTASWLEANPDLAAGVLARLALGRFAEPADVVGAVLFLASPAASYITGQTLLVDGGWSVT
jgi:NAD(P)-dependent dehydrogenase (short-subunit alcohol dehydrogenase family)